MNPETRMPRRRDRGEDERWIRAFLSRAPFGVLAVSRSGGAPHLNTNLFAYDREGEAILVHTARTGALADALRSPAPAGFTAFQMGRLLPAREALEFSVEYESVAVEGVCRTLRNPEEEREALQLILDKYAPHLRPGRDYRPIVQAELTRTSVYRLDIEAWSGKRKRAADDFPGAYRFGEVDRT